MNSQVPATTTFTVAIVARRLGVAAATLRTWDRRYGLGPSAHQAGAHRRYTIEDLARLESMRRMVNAGVPACDAARISAEADVSQLPQIRYIEDISNAVAAQNINLESGTAVAKGLIRAASSLDPIACHAIIVRAIKQRGVIKSWNEVIAPVLVAVGEKWSTTNRGVEVEHMLSDQIVLAFMQYTNSLVEPINSRPVLLACAPDEMHSLPLYAVGAALAERQIGSRNLGARIPHESLVSAMERIGPSAVLVWSQTTGISDPVRLAGLPHLRPIAKIFAGGPGWPEPLPPGVTKVSSLSEAVNSLAKSSVF
jgi:DNA-binding transcriptional MerR regulator